MIPNRFKIIYEVTRKELFEHFKTMRLLVISIIFVTVFFIIMGLGHYIVGGDVPVYERGANEALGVLLAFASLFPPIIAIVLAYDVIVGERTRRSLHLVLSKPVDRSSIFTGKFLGAFLSISIVYLIVCTVGYIVVIIFSGKVPNLNEVGRAYGAIGIILFSAACWVLFVMLFSTSFKTVTSTIVFSVMFWLFILNLLSQSGLIYYMFTQETGDETITVDLLVSQAEGQEALGGTSVIFMAHNYGVPALNVEYDVRSENGSEVQGNKLFSLLTFYLLPSGNYTWTAEAPEEDTKNMETIAKGSFYIGHEFVPYVSIVPFMEDNDDYYNDVVLLLGTGVDSNFTFDLQVTSLEDNKVVHQELDYNGQYFLKDLEKGDYRLTVSNENMTYMNTTIHSYGSEASSSQMYYVLNDDVEFPGYVKLTYALNPDNAATISYEILSDSGNSGVLTIGEGILALCLIFLILFCLGLLIFSRIELL